MDPQSTSDGKPYGPHRYKEITRERWFISKNINTSYNDIGKITPKEREYLIEFITDEMKRSKEYIEQKKKEQKSIK